MRDLRWGRTMVATGMFVLLVTVADTCAAQAAGDTGRFADLARSIKAGQMVIVTDTGGVQQHGKVADIDGSSLTILTKGPNGETTRETLVSSKVREVRLTGPIWDKAIYGAVIGAVPALFVEDCTGCMSQGSAAMLWGAIGAGVGLGIDIAIGPKLVYRAPTARTARITVSPVLSQGRRSAALTLRF